MENIGERIQKYIRSKSIRVGDFESKIGVSQGYISKIITREASSIRTDLVTKIVRNYPDVNMYWLILGEGEMLIDPSTINGSSERELELERLLSYYKDLVKELKSAMSTPSSVH